MSNRIPRREFLRQSTALLSAVPILGQAAGKKQPVLPRRTLGRTGMDVSVLAFGAGGFFQNIPDGEWEPVLQRALDLGINYFDGASAYHFNKNYPHSETRLGQVLPKYRKSIYVCTKLDERDPEKAKKELEECLKRLRMDYVDVLMAHGIREKETDVASLEKGIYAQLRKWKEEGIARHIGFSSMMTDGPRIQQLIEVLDPDMVLIAINATKFGNVAGCAIPAARAKKSGFMAMKMLRDVVGKNATAKELLLYALTQPGVDSLCVGHSNLQELEENVRIVREFTMGRSTFDRKALEKRVAHLGTPEALGWARPDYRDGGGDAWSA
jgi:uncharacterized protein